MPFCQSTLSAGNGPGYRGCEKAGQSGIRQVVCGEQEIAWLALTQAQVAHCHIQ